MQAPTPETHLETYRREPTQGNLHAVVNSLGPVLHHSLSSIGGHDDPALQIHARTLTARAVKRFDPAAGAGLATWVSSQLQPLRRLRRDIQSPVHIPERAQLEAYKLHKAEQSFYDEHDRLPDVVELADHTGVPINRIAKIRRSFRKVPSEAAMGGAGTQVTEPDHTDEALEYVYRDSDHIDRRIIELKTGYGGETPVEPKEVARLLNLTPSQLTRRSARIEYKLLQNADALKEV